MNNHYRPISEEEVKSKKTDVLNKLNIFLKKHKPGALKDISERKKQLREKAIKAFGDIQIDKLTYTQSPEKLFSDQNLLLHNKQKEFLIENKSEILNLLEFIENVGGKNLSSNNIEKHLFDMTNVNTKLENTWYNITNFTKKNSSTIGFISTLPGFLAVYTLGGYYFDPKNYESLIDFSIYLGAIGGFLIGGLSAETLHDKSKIAKRADEIKSLNNKFVKAYLYHDECCKNMMENKI